MPSGIGGSIVFPAGELCVRRWTLTRMIDIQDATDSCADGWKVKEGTLKDGSGSFEAFWKAGNIIDADMSLDIGDLLAAVFRIGNSGLGYTVSMIIKQVEIVNDATGPLLIQNCQFEVTGPIVGPGPVA